MWKVLVLVLLVVLFPRRNLAASSEPLGPSSRRTGLIISEIMYKPAPRGDLRDLEFLELYNSNPFPEEISGYRFTGEIDFTFPSNTVLNGRSFLVAARSPADIQAVYGLNGVHGYGTTNFFTNVVSGVTNIVTNVVSLGSSGTLKLLNNQGALLLSVPYSNKSPWPVGADGTGHSLVLARPSCGEDNPGAWDISDVKGGSPGRLEVAASEPLRNVVINEFLLNVTGSVQQFVELYNHSNAAADVSGAYLSDVASSLKFRIPSGTIMPARGYLSFQGAALGFFLNPAGGNIYLMNSNNTRVLDAVSYEGQANGISSGRSPDGGPLIYPLASRTPGTSNVARAASDIVINEILYEPISGFDDDEFVELYNGGPGTISLQDWQLTGGISFIFPTNTVVLPHSYLVVAHNVTNLAARYPTLLTCTNAVGDYTGKLGNNGDRIALSKPVPAATTNSTGQLRTNMVQAVVDEVSYGSGGKWGQWARGGGASLEKIDWQSDGRLAPNWVDSDAPTNVFLSLSASGVLDQGMGPADQLEIIFTGEGECLIDNVEVKLDNSSANFVTNSDFEMGSSGWIAEGNHSRSTLDTTIGYKSSQSLHLRATGPGDAVANRVFTWLSAPLPIGHTATIRARVNWLRGQNQVIMRIRGGYLEATRVPRLSPKRGTPGAINSRYLSSAPPAISAVTHSPAVPAANEPVIVTGRIDSSSGIGVFALRYRTDPSIVWSSVAMGDNGVAGDAVAGDGIFSAAIPGQPAGTLVAFYLEASGPGSSATALFPAGAPSQECLVRFGDPRSTNNFGSYRVWVTSHTLNLWTNRSPLSSEPLDATFVYNDSRIIYNAGAAYAADPLQPNFDSPIGQPCHYRLRFPPDDLFLGATDLNKLRAPGNLPGDDDTLQRAQAADWMARQLGLAAGYKRHINFFFNGVRRGTLMEDAQVPDREFLVEWFTGGADATFFVQQPWFETTETGSPTNYGGCTLNDFVTGDGARNVARFRSNWNPEGSPAEPDPFEAFFGLVDAAQRGYLNEAADLDQWAHNFALQHALGNVDSFGNLNSFNSYAYALTGEPWQLLPGSFNKVLGNGSSGPIGDDLFQFYAVDTALTELYASRSFRRSYWTSLRQIADGPMNGSHVNALLDAKYAALQSNGITAASPASVKTWIADRRDYLLAQLGAVSASFSLAGPNRFTTNENAVVLHGTAPIDTEAIRINGTQFVVSWESETNWSVTYFLQKGTNHLQIQAVDYQGSTQTNATAAVDVIYQLDALPPQGYVLINEIMYHPFVGGGSYVELYNSSVSYNFDLSNWRLDGVDFTFPLGTVLRHQAFLMVVANRSVFTSLYGNSIPVAGQFSGGLSNDGELLTLLIPGETPAEDVIVDQVRYEPIEPWPAFANGGGASLQLVDPRQDNSRVSNWSVQVPGSNPIVFADPTPGASNSTMAALPEYPLLWLNEVEPSNLSGITNRVGQRGPWLELFNSSATTIALSQFFLSDQWDAPAKWQFPAGALIGPRQFLIVWADGQSNQTTASEWHTTFRLQPTNGFVALSRIVAGQPQIMDYLKYAGLPSDQSYGCYPDAQGAAREIFLDVTPGRSNNIPPRVYINEWMASNTGTLHDPADGDTEDWFELFNATYHLVDISGWYLTDTLAKKTMFRIPDGTILGPRDFLLVWADGEPEQNGPDSPDLHVNFSLSKSGEAIGLYGPDQSLKDFVTFGPQIDDISQGRFADGSTNTISMELPTPDRPNIVPPTYPRPPPIVAGGGQTIVFVVGDATAAPFTQNFALGPDAPPGAVINPFTGEFSWTPPPVAVATTNVFTIIVCDLRPGFFPSTLTVTIIVLPSFFITSIEQDSDGLHLTWNSVLGRKYRVQFALEVTGSVWKDRSADLFAPGATLFFTVSGITNAHEFYRILELP